MTQVQWLRRVIKPSLFVFCLVPLALLVWNGLNDQLSANPIDDITDETGTWTLRFILITLAVTPLRRITGWSGVQQLRRMLGLFAFFYGSLHFLTYIYLDQFFAWDEIVADIAKRPFITVGFASFLLMIPLAATSTDRMARLLGGRRWNFLHRAIYLTAIGGVVHYLWLVKADIQRPATYGVILAALLLYRVWSAVPSKLFQRRGPTSRAVGQPQNRSLS